MKKGPDPMAGSTYKRFGGPTFRMIFSNSAELAERLDKVPFSVLSINFDLSRVATIAISVLDLLTHEQEYAPMFIASTKVIT